MSLVGRKVAFLVCVPLAGSAGCAQVLGLEESTVVSDGGSSDSATSDTSTSDSNPPVDGNMPDGPMPPGSRDLIALFNAPDLASEYLCMASFASPPDADSGGPPKRTAGPYGLGGSDLSKQSGFPYGRSFHVPGDGLALFDDPVVVIYALDTNPATTPDGAGACAGKWPSARTDAKRRVRFDMGMFPSNDAWAIALYGCAGSGSASGECGPGNNLQFGKWKLDRTHPGASTLAIQAINLSVYAGSMPPSFAKLDIYFQAMNSSSATAGSPQAIGTGVNLGSASAAAAFTALGSAPQEALLLAEPTGNPLCTFSPGSMPMCPLFPLSIKDAIAAESASDSEIKVAGGRTLVIGVSGGPGNKDSGPALRTTVARVH